MKEVKRAGKRKVKISTNRKEFEFDRDGFNVKAIKNLKLTYKLSDKGCLILKGIIRCEYKDDFCGKFVCFGATQDGSADFDSIRGIYTEIDFSNPTAAISSQKLKCILRNWVDSPNLVYNIKQFDEFMDLFKFYKTLSSELNNEQSFKIARNLN